jgi:long-chain acyl-CoA synthetase
LLNLFPLPRDAGFRDSFAFAGESVDRGYSILVFPEGHHTTDGKMRPFRSGVGLLLNDLNIPAVPIRIDGLFELKKAGKRMARPYQIQVHIGLPIKFSSGSAPQDIAEQLKSQIEQL